MDKASEYIWDNPDLVYKYELVFQAQKRLYSIEDYYDKFGRYSNKCEICEKSYKLPNTIFEPRDKICRTCERKLVWRKSYLVGPPYISP